MNDSSTFKLSIDRLVVRIQLIGMKIQPSLVRSLEGQKFKYLIIQYVRNYQKTMDWYKRPLLEIGAESIQTNWIVTNKISMKS